MKERWLAELAAAAVLAVLALLLWKLFHKDEPIAVPSPEPRPKSTSEVEPPPIERARLLREQAFEECDRSQWRPCLDKLDEAKRLDPTGDRDPKVGAARQRASDALLQNDAPQKKEAPPSVPTSRSAPSTEPTSAPVPQSTAPVKRAPAPKPKSDGDVKQMPFKGSKKLK